MSTLWEETNLFVVMLDYLDHCAASDLYQLVTQELAGAMAKVMARVRPLPEDDAELDEAYALIEELLGAVFVTLQTWITEITSEAIKLCARAVEESPRVPVFRDRRSTLAIHPEVQLVEAVANYWKHRDEWNPFWENLNDQQTRTAAKISTMGLTSGSTGNFRQAARFLGVTDYSDLTPLTKHVRAWARDVVVATETELNSLGLI